MKIRCIHNTVTKGIINKHEEKIKGLTKGNIYQGTMVPIADNVRLTHGTTIELDDIVFMIYDDNKEWNTYKLGLFEPVEETNESN